MSEYVTRKQGASMPRAAVEVSVIVRDDDMTKSDHFRNCFPNDGDRVAG